MGAEQESWVSHGSPHGSLVVYSGLSHRGHGCNLSLVFLRTSLKEFSRYLWLPDSFHLLNTYYAITFELKNSGSFFMELTSGINKCVGFML